MAGSEGDHELGASGDGGVVFGGVGEDLEDRVEGGGGGEIVLGDIGAHYLAAPMSAAARTASKMRV